MEVSPKTLREVEFREKMRGYHPEDVDHFLEEAAVSLENLYDRLRQAVERAQRAEAAAADSGGTDATLRNTLVLAQRTADLAVKEAHEEAARIRTGAEQQAHALLTEAEDRARRAHDEAVSEIRAELGTLEAVRQRGQQEVDLLDRWVEEHRTHLASTLKEALVVVERAGTLSPPPTSRTIDLTSGSRPGVSPSVQEASAADNARPPARIPGPPLDNGSPVDNGPSTTAWRLPDPESRATGDSGPQPQFGSLRRAGETGPGGAGPGGAGPGGAGPGGAGPGGSGPGGAGPAGVDPSSWDTGPHPVIADHEAASNPEDQALDDFFDDGDVDEDRRFGGRLRRRR